MLLCQALQVRKGEIIAFVGAGGKTTAMYRLGHELADRGWRVITTTTTMIRPPSREQTPALIMESDGEAATFLAKDALRSRNLVTVAAERLEAGGKLKGVEPGVIASLAQVADAVIVEADGAKGLSLKAPASYEPVIPAATTLLIPVVGIDAVGRRLAADAVHRPQLVSALTGLQCGQLIDISTVATLLVHEQGGLKGAPTNALVMPLINKVHDPAALARAREVAGRIKSTPALDRVLVGAVAADDPILECWRRVSAVVLAAGASTRLGRPKQLLPVAETTMIAHVLQALRNTSVHEVVVVLGHVAEQIAQYIPPWCRIVVNTEWRAGISSSIRAGLEAVDDAASSALFVPVDQPRLTSTQIEHILRAHYKSTEPIVVPVYGGQRGTPALFSRSLFPFLKALEGDVGGRQLIERFPDHVQAVQMPSSDVLLDIDTPVDYEDFLKEKQGAQADKSTNSPQRR